MAADNNDSDDTNSGSGHPSNQGKGGRDDREGEGNGGKSKPNDAAPEEGEGRRQRRASSRRIRNNNGNGNLKVFRRLNNPHPRNIPAARFIQGYNEYAYICESEEDESEREYLPTAARRRGEGAVVHRLQRQQQGWATATKVEEEEAKKNDASALSVFSGKKLSSLELSPSTAAFSSSTSYLQESDASRAQRKDIKDITYKTSTHSSASQECRECTHFRLQLISNHNKPR
eukprot:scaffold9107_cov104-Skeletonema_dohrnii-CCMP3373.AAC.4